jgi:hypothetical protein
MKFFKISSKYILLIYTCLFALTVLIAPFSYSYQGVLKLSAFQAMCISLQYFFLISISFEYSIYRNQIHFMVFALSRNQLFFIELKNFLTSPFLLIPHTIFTISMLYLSPLISFFDGFILTLSCLIFYFFIITLCVFGKFIFCKQKINQNLFVLYNVFSMYYLASGNFLLKIENNSKYEYYNTLQWFPHYVFFTPINPQLSSPMIFFCYLYPFAFLFLLKKHRDWL